MKKILALILAICMIAAVGTVAFADGEPITLNVIIAQYGPNTQNWFLGDGMDGSNFVTKFEAANPDIKLNLEVIAWAELDTVVETRITSGQTPDILNNDDFSNYQASGLLLPVSDYCTDELFADFFPSFIANSVVDDVCWAVPDLASARALYYNVDMFEEVGIEVPSTWAELEDAAQAIVDFYNGEVYPWGIDMTTDEGQAAFAYYAWGNGGGFVNENDEWVLNSDENVEALQYAINLYKNGYTNPNPATQTRYDLQDMFGAGKLAMVIGPQNIPTYLSDKDYTVNYSTANIPANEGKTSSSAGVMDRIMAFRNDGYADQAARNEAIGKFMTFFYDPENYVGWVSMEGFLPAVNSAVGALVEADPSFAAWLDVLGGAKFYPSSLVEWNDVRQGVITAEQNCLTGADVRAELDALQAAIVG